MLYALLELLALKMIYMYYDQYVGRCMSCVHVLMEDGKGENERERKREPKPNLLPVTFQLTPFVDCCVCLLDRPDLLPSPLSQGRLISVLLAFINSDKRQPQAG